MDVDEMARAETYFAGKNALITGGSSGIGMALARLLADRGANIFILARDQHRLNGALQQIEAAQVAVEQRFGAFPCDVTSLHDVVTAVATIVEVGGVPDILINSAGIVRPGYFEELPPTTFRDQMDVNYLGTVHAVRAVLPHMMERSSGHIVNISSVAGVIGVFGYTGYAASKFAVRGFSEALRIELKPYNIRVSVVIPDDTDTPQLTGEKRLQPLETQITEGILKPEKLEGPAEALAYRFVKLIVGSGEPLSAEQVAEAVLRGVRRERFLIAPDPLFGVAYYWRGLLIPLANWAFDTLVPVARRERGIQ